MTDLQSRLKALLYMASGAAVVDLPSVPAPAPAVPQITDDMCSDMDETFEFITVEPFALTPMQRKARAEFEEAMRAGELRHPPSVFGAL